jgi:hypothetical protein
VAALLAAGTFVATLATIGSGVAGAAVEIYINSPFDGAHVTWDHSTTFGECRQVGAGAVIESCHVSVFRMSDSPPTQVVNEDVGPQSDPNVRSWTFDLPCVDGAYRTLAVVVGTGGGVVSKSNDYTITCPGGGGGGPTGSIGGPADGTSYVPGVGAPPTFHGSCGAGTTSSSMTVTKPNGAVVSIADGQAVPTDQLGTYTISVSCTGPGGTSTTTSTYSVHNTPPTASISSPPDGSKGPDGRSFYVNEAVTASYGCSDVDGNLTSCVGGVPNGANLDTSSTGAKNLHVTATDAFGATGTADSGYQVYRRPEAHITGPADGAVFTPGQDPTPVFHGGCQFGIPALACTSTVQHWTGTPAIAIADGDAVPTAPYGLYTLRTHASDARPTTADDARTVRANRPPIVTVANTPSTPTTFATGPQAGKRYFVGQTVYASYTCDDLRDTDFIPVNVVSCVGNVPNGAPIDTATVGHKAFTVTAIDNDGGRTVVTVPYTVHPVVGPCRGSGARVLGVNLGVANEPMDPCVVTDKATVQVFGIGSLLGVNLNGVNAGILTASTAKGVGSQTATATATNLNVGVLGVSLNVKALTSTATARLYDCDASAVATYSDEIAGLTVSGTPIKVTNVPLAINLVIGTLYLNQVTKVDGAHGGSTITVRPIHLDLAGPLPDVSIGEVVAGAECGPLPT